MAKVSLRSLIVVLLLQPVCALRLIEDHETESFAKGTAGILEKAVNEFRTAKIGIYADDITSFDGQVDGIMKHANVIFKLSDMNKEQPFMCYGVCLLMMQSMDNLKSFMYSIVGESESTFYIKYIKQASTDDIMKHHLENPDFRLKTYYIVNAKDSIDLIAIVMHTAKACNKTQLIVINRYQKAGMKWDKPMPVISTAVEFHSCPMYFELQGRNIGVNITKVNDEEVKITGAVAEIFKDVARVSNFTPNFGITRDLTLVMDLDRLKYRPVKIGPSLFLSSNSVIKAVPFYYAGLYFIVPQGEPLTDWEILTLAFDETTWILIGVTFFTAFTVIFVIHAIQSTTVRNFVFGRNVTTPSLNVIATFFGLGQIAVPKRNFARFLLTLWIIWSLIFRTCYQGKLFGYLQSELRHPEIQTIEEMMNHNFSYYVDMSNLLMFFNNMDYSWMPKFRETNNRHGFSPFEFAMTPWQEVLQCYLESPAATNILIADTFQIIDYHSTKPNKTLLMMNERYSEFYGGIHTYCVPYLRAAFESAIANMSENGILSNLMDQQYKAGHFRPEPEPKEPEVLTLAQVAVGFKLHGIFLGLSLAVFIIERFIHKMRTRKAVNADYIYYLN